MSRSPNDSSGRNLLIVGGGRMGRSLAADLSPLDLFTGVAVVGRPGDDSRPGVLATAAPAIRPNLFFCVPDDALEEVAEDWAEWLAGAGEPPGREHDEGTYDATDRNEAADSKPAIDGPPVALHTSGARPAAVLSPLRDRCGYAIGSWHPLVSLASPRAGAFSGVAVGIEGDGPALELGEAVALAVGGHPLRIEAGSKARYHAAAVFASNYLVACLHAAADELMAAVTAGASRAAASDASPGAASDASQAAASDASQAELTAGADQQPAGSELKAQAAAGESQQPADDLLSGALLPLARSALDNVEQLGLRAGATGPISRGDVNTIESHLAALDPSRRELYRALGRELLAAVAPRLDPEVRARLAALLGTDRNQNAGEDAS